MSKLKIQKNKEKIVALLNQNIDLEYSLRLKSYHSVYEMDKDIGTKKEPKVVKLTLGKWFEWFKDESRPNKKGVKIERNEIIAVDGQRSNGYKLIEYFTIDDL